MAKFNGTSGSDALTGTSRGDDIYGYDGNDTLIGGAGDDKLYGGKGNDSLDGGDGNDTLYGSDGDNTLLGGNGDDLLVAGRGGHNELRGGQGNDTLQSVGGSGDFLYGDEGDDFLQGGNGDVVTFMMGGEGNDHLQGGSGDDRMRGDAGADVFVFAYGGGSDTVYDYEAGDKIELGRSLEVSSLTFERPAEIESDENGQYFVFNNLLIRNSGGDELELRHFFLGSQDLVFTDGTHITQVELAALAPIDPLWA